MAMRLANTLAEVYREDRIAEGNKRSVGQKAFVESQLGQAREKLKASEEAVKTYREQNKLVSYDAESASLFTKLQTAQAAYDKARCNCRGFPMSAGPSSGWNQRPWAPRRAFISRMHQPFTRPSMKSSSSSCSSGTPC